MSTCTLIYVIHVPVLAKRVQDRTISPPPGCRIAASIRSIEATLRRALKVAGSQH